MPTPNAQAIQTAYGTIPVIVTIIIAIWIQNQRMTELSKRIDDMGSNLGKRIDDMGLNLGKRIDDLRSYMASEIVSLREFIRSEIKRLEERIERLEHPIMRR